MTEDDLGEVVPEEPENGSAPPPSIPLPSILETLSRMSQDLERAWSDALTSEDAREAREATLSSWRSFISALVDYNENAQPALSEIGLDKIGHDFPIRDETLAKLESDPADPLTRARQLDLALIYLLKALVEALGGLQTPSASSTNLLTGETINWWEGGAFALVRRRSRTLQRLLRERDRVFSELGVPGAEPPGASPSFEAWEALLSAAHLVWDGQHDAAILLLARALRLYVAMEKGVPAEQLPSPREALDGGTWESLIPLAERLEDATARLASGAPVSAGFVVSLAEAGLARLEELEREVLFREIPRPDTQTPERGESRE